MKKILISLLAMSCVGFAYSQDEGQAMSIDYIMNACIEMQEALENSNNEGLTEAANKMRKSNVNPFSTLECIDEDVSNNSLNGHFVFSEAFVDSLQNGASAYDNADKIQSEINNKTDNRGQTPDGKILTKTCLVKAGKSTKYTFPSNGRQELGIVAEPGGLVVVRIHATNDQGLDEWHNDTRNPNGVRRFKTAFDLPANIRSYVELEVINKSTKDISFIVISN